MNDKKCKDMLKSVYMDTEIKQSVALTTKAATIKRNTGYRKRHRENDAEHGYQVAIVAWAANHQYKLHLNEEKILKLALTHDLAEIYTDDIDSFGDKKRNSIKKELEQKALKKLKKEFHLLKMIAEPIVVYERKDTDESMLVNIIDKIIPIMHDYEINSNYYKKRKVTFQMYKEWLYRKTKYEELPQKFKKIVDEHLVQLAKSHTHLFYPSE
jgi:5'-deoxynucleotidase YfbR-like HD superfamily hydrolase